MCDIIHRGGNLIYRRNARSEKILEGKDSRPNLKILEKLENKEE